MEGHEVNAGEVRRTWADWLLITAATLIFVGLGALAGVPHLEIQTGWAGMFAVLLLLVLVAGGVLLWRVTKFT